MAKILALTNDGRITYCTASEENRGRGRCPHLTHQATNESEEQFVTRAQTLAPNHSFTPVTITTSRLAPDDVAKDGVEAKYKDIAEGEDGKEYYIQMSEGVWNDADAAAYADYLIEHGKASRSSRAGLIKKITERANESEESYKTLNEEAEANGFKTTTKVPVLPLNLRPSFYSKVGETEEASPLTKEYQSLYRLRERGYAAQKKYRELVTGEKEVKKRDNTTYTVPVAGNGLRNFLDGGKSGYVRRELTGRTIPYTGRGVIVPNAKLDIDEIAIPAPIAAKIFKPTIDDALMSKGYSREDIDQFLDRCSQTKFRSREEEVQSLTDKARLGKILAVTEVRVLANRQPSLHYGSLQSFKPRVSAGAVIETNPSIDTQYACDYDGDTFSLIGLGSVDISRVADRAMGANTMTCLPREKEQSAMLPTKEIYWGLLNVLRNRKVKD